jgi:hypothetical protein
MQICSFLTKNSIKNLLLCARYNVAAGFGKSQVPVNDQNHKK